MHPIRAKRHERGLTQQALATLAHVQAAELSRIENAQRQPTIGTLRKLARVLDCPVGELIPSAALEEALRQGRG